eukprot:Opistho-2@33059
MAGAWGEQFTAGDQTLDLRMSLYESWFKECSLCGADVTEDVNCAGCRHNGDGYGTSVFTCDKCGWSTSFQYDEAGDTYFYETRSWKKRLPSKSVSELGEWMAKNRLGHLVEAFRKKGIDGTKLGKMSEKDIAKLGATEREARSLYRRSQ